MKRIATVLITLIVCNIAVADSELVFSNQVITVRESNLALESVRFQPEATVTNTILEWEAFTEYYTNSLFNPPVITADPNASRQVSTTLIETNPARWVADVQFSLPRGYKWELNGIPVEIDRFSTRLEINIDPASVQAVFGSAYPGLLFAATSGNYQPRGQVRDGFLMLAAQVLAEGVE